MNVALQLRRSLSSLPSTVAAHPNPDVAMRLCQRARLLIALPSLACALAATACADDAGSASALCPAGTTEHAREDQDRRVRYCLDAAGLAHGPYLEERPPSPFPDDGDGDGPPDPAFTEGAFVHGQPDGTWLYRFDPQPLTATADAIQYIQGWSAGLEHGLWQERAPDGAVLAEQHYDHARRCGTWRRWDPGALTEVVFTPCADLPPLDLPDVPPPGDAPPSWDGATCPAGTRVIDGAATWCEIDALRAGPYRYDDGATVVDGHYAAGLRDGRWRLWSAGRLATDGHYAAGLLDGSFARYHPSGQPAATGAYAAGLRTGVWSTTYPNGLPLTRGAWVDGLHEGLHERFATSGVATERVTWRAGLRDGPATTAYDDGAPECDGAYAGDRRTGPWTCRHPNGQPVTAGSYTRGSREGLWRGFEPDGRTHFEGAYVAGLPTGTWTVWSDSPLDGQRVALSGAYHGGERDGPWTSRWVADDALAAAMVFDTGRLHGPYVSFYHDGTPFQDGTYQDDEQHDHWVVHYADGELAIDAWFYAGVRHGPWRSWWPNGQPRLVATYIRGVLQPDAEAWDADGQPIAPWEAE